MDHELSQRLGRAMSSKAAFSLGLKKFEIPEAVKDAETFEDLPAWVKMLIMSAESENKGK